MRSNAVHRPHCHSLHVQREVRGEFCEVMASWGKRHHAIGINVHQTLHSVLRAEVVVQSSNSLSDHLQVMPYTWGEPSGRLPQAPDVIIGADVVYEQEQYAALVSTLRMLAAPHTVVYLSYRLRGMLPPYIALVLRKEPAPGGCSTLQVFKFWSAPLVLDRSRNAQQQITGQAAVGGTGHAPFLAPMQGEGRKTLRACWQLKGSQACTSVKISCMRNTGRGHTRS